MAMAEFIVSACNPKLIPSVASPVKQLKAFLPKQVLRHSSVQAWGQSSAVWSMRLVISQLNEPRTPKIQLSEVTKRVLQVVPEPVKQVPWKKAENIFLSKLLDVAEKALKWIVMPLCALSVLCDVIFSISRNKELLIPVGLFVGCIVADLFNETLQELFCKSVETGSSRQLLYMSAFFVLIRLLSSSLPLSASVFFMHVANGGLMQVFWLWRNSHEGTTTTDSTDTTVPIQGAS